MSGLRKKAEQRRLDMGLGDDPDAWCWLGEDVPVEAQVANEAKEVAKKDAAQASRAELVAKRLLGPHHMPAVREAMGVLIPGAFHPKNVRPCETRAWR